MRKYSRKATQHSGISRGRPGAKVIAKNSSVRWNKLFILINLIRLNVRVTLILHRDVARITS